MIKIARKYFFFGTISLLLLFVFLLVGNAEAQTISFTGKVGDVNKNPVSGATISVVGNPSITAPSDPSGNFTLDGLPSGTNFWLKISQLGYLDTYSGDFNSTSHIDQIGTFTLVTDSDIGSLYSASGVTRDTSKGVISGRVYAEVSPEIGYVNGVQLTATGTSKTYPVTYFDDNGPITGGTSTTTTGRFFVLNVDDGDTVTIAGTKTNWTGLRRVYKTFANSVNDGRIIGTTSSSISYKGTVNDGTQTLTPLQGVSVQLFGNSGISTTTDSSGNYTLEGVPPDTTVELIFTKSGFIPTYSAYLSFTSNHTSAHFYSLLTQSRIEGWGVQSGKGVIWGVVMDYPGYVEGAVVTYTSSRYPSSPPYSVKYFDGISGHGFSGTTTYPDGFFFILDVEEGDIVKVTATKTGLSFHTPRFETHANAVSQSVLFTKYSISGIVKDFSDQGIQVAKVTIKDSNNTVIGELLTDASGNFNYEAYLADFYTLEASKTGFDSITPPQLVGVSATIPDVTVNFSMVQLKAPNTPTNTSPTNASTNIALTPTLTSSAFVSADDATHTGSQWTMKGASDIIVYQTQTLDASGNYTAGYDANNRTSFTLPKGILKYSTPYKWQVQYKDNRAITSVPSTLTTFTTLANPGGYDDYGVPTAAAPKDASGNTIAKIDDQNMNNPEIKEVIPQIGTVSPIITAGELKDASGNTVAKVTGFTPIKSQGGVGSTLLFAAGSTTAADTITSIEPISVTGKTVDASGNLTVTAIPNLSVPSSISLPYGLFNINITVAGASTKVVIVPPSPFSSGTKWYKVNQATGGLVEYPNFVVDAGGNGILTLTDNGFGDADPRVGFIRDPSGPGADVISLSAGWNLISVPHEFIYNNVLNVLANIQNNVEIVWGFTPPDTWVKYGPTLPSVLNTLTELVPGKGYWIKAKADITNFSVTGTEKTLTLNFAKDWNLIGINGSTSQNITTLLANIQDNVEIVWGFTPPDTWVKYGPTLPSVLNTLTELVPGKGYWIKLKATGITLDIP